MFLARPQVKLLTVVNTLTAILSAVSAVIASVITYLISRKQQSGVDFKVILDRYADDIAALKADLSKERDERRKLETELRQMQADTSMWKTAALVFKGKDMGIPIPRLKKDEIGNVMEINHSFVQNILAPAGHSKDDYLGSNDMEFWSTESLNTIIKGDNVSMQGMDWYIGITLFDDLEKGHVEWVTIKYPIYSVSQEESRIIGVEALYLSKDIFEKIKSVIEKQ
jgi:hypothetical protein